MEKLEDKIIKKIYLFETKKTVREVVWQIVVIIIGLLLTFFFGQILLEVLKQQQTLDVLQIFQEDFSVIQHNIGYVIEVLYYEIPHLTFALFLMALFVLICCLLIFIKNSGKIKNRVKAIINYWYHSK